MLYPLTFAPIFKERVWGGRRLAELYGKALPPDAPFGESWELTDRAEGVSVIANGPLAGKHLRWLMEHHARALLGSAHAAVGRFPLLLKILDAQDKLSLQVHPPAPVAKALNGEPKTELWFVASAAPGAELFVGLKLGVTRDGFERALRAGEVAHCFHRLAVRAGDVMFLPSGRVHAIGAGCVIFEIQQNSDTTYRVFDWNRAGLDGRPRELHIAQALRSIDFQDFEPLLTPNPLCEHRRSGQHVLVEPGPFRVTAAQLAPRDSLNLPGGEMHILAVTEGALAVHHETLGVALKPGDFCLLPAGLAGTQVAAQEFTRFLITEAGSL